MEERLALSIGHNAAATGRSFRDLLRASRFEKTKRIDGFVLRGRELAAEKPEMRGVHHWTDAGVASWYDFAVAIQEEALALGLLDRVAPVRPLRTEEYRTRARRPCYSVLEKSRSWAALGRPIRHWRESLRLMLRELVRP